MGRFQDKLDSIQGHMVAKIKVFEWLADLSIEYSNSRRMNYKEFLEWFEGWFK